MGVPASCTTQAAEKGPAVHRPHKYPKPSADKTDADPPRESSAFNKAKERVAARAKNKREQAEREKLKTRTKSLTVERNFRDQYTVVRGWKPKKRRHCGVGGGLRDAWGVWDIAVDMTCDEQPHRTAVFIPRSSIITPNDEAFKERVEALQKVKVVYDVFVDEQDVIVVYDTDPEECVPVLDAGAITEEGAATWMRKIINLLLTCHRYNVFLGASALNRIVGESLASADLIGVGIFGSLARAPWDLEEEEIGKDWLAFVAPELLDGSGGQLGELSDAWTIGMLLYALLSGGPPFDSRTLRKQGPRKPILDFTPSFKGEPWAEVSTVCVDFIRTLLTPDPRRRCSLAYALHDSPWLRPERAGEGGLLRSRTMLNELGEFRERARRHQMSSALRRAARRFAAEQLPRSSMTALEKTFRSMDTDNDGLISVEQVRMALKEHGINFESEENSTGTDDYLDELIVGAFGAGGSDSPRIDLVEFAAVLLDEHQLQQKDSLLVAFRRFDVEGSGYITRAQIAAALTEAGFEIAGVANGKLSSELDQLVSIADANGDDRIDFEEFARLLRLDGEILDEKQARLSRVNGDGLWNTWLTRTCACCSAETGGGDRKILFNR